MVICEMKDLEFGSFKKVVEVFLACVYRLCICAIKRKKWLSDEYIYTLITGGASWLKTNLPLILYAVRELGATCVFTNVPLIHVLYEAQVCT